MRPRGELDGSRGGRLRGPPTLTVGPVGGFGEVPTIVAPAPVARRHGRLRPLDRCDQTVALLRDRLDVARLARFVPEGSPQLADRIIEDPVVGLPLLAPNVVEELFPGDHLPRVVGELQEDSDGFVGQSSIFLGRRRSVKTLKWTHGLQRRSDEEITDAERIRGRERKRFLLNHSPPMLSAGNGEHFPPKI